MLNQEFTHLTKKSKFKKKIIIYIKTISANSQVKSTLKAIILNISQRSRT